MEAEALRVRRKGSRRRLRKKKLGQPTVLRDQRRRLMAWNWIESNGFRTKNSRPESSSLQDAATAVNSVGIGRESCRRWYLTASERQ